MSIYRNTIFKIVQWLIAILVVGSLTAGCEPTEPAETSTPTQTNTPTQTATPTIPAATATMTPTPTLPPPALPTVTATQPPSACSGLAGYLEVAVLVGPADVAGLTPDAVGQIPFAASGSGPYPISGSGSINYEDTLIKEWGTYAVTLNMAGTITGSCSGPAGAEQLHLDIELSGDQLVVVTSEGFNAEYPWSGTHQFALDFPLMDGATVQGEGWAFTLHITAG